MKQENHTQVRLRKIDTQMSGYQDTRWKEYICYVPSQFANKGRFLDIKNEQGNWEDGWCVHEVYHTLPTVVVREREQDYKQTRKASDI